MRVGGKPIPDRVGDSVLAFIFLYFMTVALLTFALLLTGLDFDSSFSAVVASINNAGPGLGSVGPAAELPGPLGRADLDLHPGHAARAPRDLQRSRAADARLLAQVGASSRQGGVSSQPCATKNPVPASYRRMHIEPGGNVNADSPLVSDQTVSNLVDRISSAVRGHDGFQRAETHRRRA